MLKKSVHTLVDLQKEVGGKFDFPRLIVNDDMEVGLSDDTFIVYESDIPPQSFSPKDIIEYIQDRFNNARRVSDDDLYETIIAADISISEDDFFDLDLSRSPEKTMNKFLKKIKAPFRVKNVNYDLTECIGWYTIIEN